MSARPYAYRKVLEAAGDLAWLADPEGSNSEQVFTLLDALFERALAAPRAEQAR